MLLPLSDALQSFSELCLRSYEMLFRRLELERQLLTQMNDEERITVPPVRRSPSGRSGLVQKRQYDAMNDFA